MNQVMLSRRRLLHWRKNLLAGVGIGEPEVMRRLVNDGVRPDSHAAGSSRARSTPWPLD